jgi:O-antigen ligase
MSLSIAPGATLREGLFLAALFLLGFLVLKTVVRGRGIRTILAVLIGSGVFQAVYGLFELTRANPRLLFYPKVFSLDSVTGTFVNRNHLSGYLEMIVPLALGLAAARMNLLTFGVKGFREKFLLWTSKGVLGSVLILAAAVVMSLGIILSRSRSGVVVLAFTVFLFFGLSVYQYSRTGFRQPWVGTSIRTTFLAVVALAVAVGVGSTIRRFALDDLLHEDRPLYWTNTLEIVGDFPLFGTGLGTFASAYGAYEKGISGDMELRHAHNDYLEAAAELGIVGAGLLFAIILAVAVRAFLAWRDRRSAQARGLALGGLVSLAGMGLHAATDFNLHVAANAVLFTVVLGLTLVMAYYRKS